MIRYTIKCDKDHRFDSWFKSAEAFDTLRAAGMVTCTECGSATVEKTLMAPSVRTDVQRAISEPADEREKAIADMKKQVEDNSEYVGVSFAKEARAIHLGEKPARSIYGEAKIEDAKSLLEDGVPVMPLPFKTSKQAN